MASFFQLPAGYQPEVAKYTHFQISWNGVLSKEQLIENWYQKLVIALGCCSLVLGCTTFVLRRMHGRKGIKYGLWDRPIRSITNGLRSWKLPSRQTSVRYTLPNERDEQSDGGQKAVDRSVKFSVVKSFRVVDSRELIDQALSDYDLCILRVPEGNLEGAFSQPMGPLPDSIDEKRRPRVVKRHSTWSNWSRSSWTTLLTDRSPKTGPSSIFKAPDDSVELVNPSDASTPDKKRTALRFGGISLTTGFTGPHAPEDTGESTAYINKLRLQSGLDGIAITYSDGDSHSFANGILYGFQQQNVPVILIGEVESSFLDYIDMNLVSGIIVQNASVYPDGKRRDFFKSARLRDVVARCKRQRKTKPTFFLGFLELWDILPSAATLRRAYKLADFFGAVVDARHRLPSHGPDEPRGMCLSAFDWLKKAEIVHLQKVWSRSPTSTTSAPFGSCENFDIAGVKEVVPSAEELLSMHPLSEALLAVTEEVPSIVEIPDFVLEAPHRSDFWTLSSCGTPLCSLGCYNIRDEIVKQQYDQILAVQRDLKEQRMLQPFTSLDISRLTNALKDISESTSHVDLLRLLLHDLTSGRLKINKGLDSGFTLPDDGGHMWGLSEVYETLGISDGDASTEIYIYISLKCSNDAATVWHTWLAHHGVSRLSRFEEDLLITRIKYPGARLPLSIQRELEESSDAELLYLIEQIRIAGTQHRFADAILAISTDLLIQQTSQTAWIAEHSRACLESTTDIRNILSMRIEHHARCGVRQLPDLDNLVRFYELLKQKMEDSLFNSDRTSLNKLSSALLDQYNSADPDFRPSVTLDIYGLMFFCALRRLAFEDIYLETTDRCPLFLSQSDQAGVFAELWVLGSQCEIYFGVQPRTLGEIIYHRYQRRLTRFPPPAEAWTGKEIFTAYSTTEPSIRVEGHPVMTGSSGPIDLPSESPGWRVDEPRTTMRIRGAARKLGALSI